VSSIVSRKTGVRNISWHGAVWGVGHTLTLLLVAGTCIVFRRSLDEHIATGLEFAVGLMLVGLGAHVIWRLWRDKVHFGVHAHGDGTRHLHAHSHRGESGPHDDDAHHHEHSHGLPWRTLLVGTMHGIAGSAALVVLTATSIESPLWAIGYVVLFGLGSVIGMALLSAIIALPLSYTARSLTVGNAVLQLVIGLVTIGVGVGVLSETGRVLLA
jgi:ABC-type nickel/cobalt efflux system permease component RcnA